MLKSMVAVKIPTRLKPIIEGRRRETYIVIGWARWYQCKIEAIQRHMEMQNHKLLPAAQVQRQIYEASKELYCMWREEDIKQRHRA
jgi:hypothetical protein